MARSSTEEFAKNGDVVFMLKISWNIVINYNGISD